MMNMDVGSSKCGKSKKLTGFGPTPHAITCRRKIQGAQIHTKAVRHMLQQMLHECHIVVTWTIVEGKGTPSNPCGIMPGITSLNCQKPYGPMAITTLGMPP